MTPHNLIEHFGSTKAAADALSVTPQSVRNWINDKRIPSYRQTLAEFLTKGKLKADKKK